VIATGHPPGDAPLNPWWSWCSKSNRHWKKHVSNCGEPDRRSCL